MYFKALLKLIFVLSFTACTSVYSNRAVERRVASGEFTCNMRGLFHFNDSSWHGYSIYNVDGANTRLEASNAQECYSGALELSKTIDHGRIFTFTSEQKPENVKKHTGYSFVQWEYNGPDFFDAETGLVSMYSTPINESSENFDGDRRRRKNGSAFPELKASDVNAFLNRIDYLNTPARL